MRLTDLTSPGSIPNSQKLRVELLKAINYVQLEGMKRGHGSTHVATLSASLADAKAAVDALAYVPVTSVAVTGAGAVAVGATLQLTATPAPAGAAGYRVVWTSADPTKVTVSDTGLVTRVADGAVVVTATSVDDPTKAGTASIT
jgi:uncharacterized protein YjdB